MTTVPARSMMLVVSPTSPVATAADGASAAIPFSPIAPVLGEREAPGFDKM